ASQPIEADENPPTEKRASLPALNGQLAKELSAGLSSHDFVSYFVANRQQKVLASSNPELVGEFFPQHEAFLTRVLSGETTVCPPFPSVVSMKDEFGRVRTGVPTMYAAAPIRDANFQIVGALALRIRPEKEFTRILQLGQAGKSGETFAIDKT